METQTLKEAGKKMNNTTQQPISPFLWFDSNAEDAVNFYISVFKNAVITDVSHYSEASSTVSGQKAGSVMTVAVQIEGYNMVAINGGPTFSINPSISFFVNCQSVQEIDSLWAKLADNGNVMMALDTYPFAEKYGWIQDKFGVSWQLIIQDREQKITPCLMFSGAHHLKAEEAILFYTSVFKNSEIIQLERYKAGNGPEDAVVHCKFTLNGQEFVAMDSHSYMPTDFNPGLSFVVSCKNQEEIDYYWDKLSKDGFEEAQVCGWLQDKYGVSWQIQPASLNEIMRNPATAEKAMKAILQMKKIDIKTLEQAIAQV